MTAQLRNRQAWESSAKYVEIKHCMNEFEGPALLTSIETRSTWSPIQLCENDDASAGCFMAVEALGKNRSNWLMALKIAQETPPLR